MSNSTNGIDRHLLAAIVIFSAISPVVLLSAPAIASQLAAGQSFKPGQIGELFSVELGAMSFATIPAYWWLQRLDCRWVAAFSCAIFVISNIAAALTFSSSLTSLMMCRAVSGLAGGSLMVLCLSSATHANNKDRVYGLWTMGQLVLGAIGLASLPLLFQAFGLGALYWSMAILMAVAAPLAISFPKHFARQREKRTEARLSKVNAALGIVGTLTFYVSLSGVWTFIGSLAQGPKLDPATVGAILSFATVLGIIGSGSATLISGRLPRQWSLSAGYLMMAAAILLLLGKPHLTRFVLAAFLFKYTWTFVLPFILASLADIDVTGQLMNTTNLVIGGGLAVGPLIAGQAIQHTSGFIIPLVSGVILTILSMAMMLMADKRLSPVYVGQQEA